MRFLNLGTLSFDDGTNAHWKVLRGCITISAENPVLAALRFHQDAMLIVRSNQRLKLNPAPVNRPPKPGGSFWIVT